MVVQAQVKGLFDIAKAFGGGGIEAALDVTEAAVAGSVGAAAAQASSCLKRKWKNSSIGDNVDFKVRRTNKGALGFVTVKHNWVDVLFLGEDVPAHTMPARSNPRKPYVMTVGKRGRPKKYSRKGGGPGHRKGQGPPVFISGKMKHPGYKGHDCAKPTQERGEKILIRLMDKNVRAFERKLAKSRTRIP